MKQRVRTLTHEIRDVDLGPKPVNLFAPLSGGVMYADIGGELVVGDRIARHDMDVQREWKRLWRERQQYAGSPERREQWAAAQRRRRARQRDTAA